MKTFELKAKARVAEGKKASKTIRKEGSVPCVMYGGKENVLFTVEYNDVMGLVYTPNVYLVKVDVEGKKYEGIMQDIQFHPVNDKILHIDFVEVVENKPVVVNVPIELFGESKGLKAGGKLRFNKRSLKVKALVSNIPDTLKVNITNVNIGGSIKVGDLSYDNLTLLDGPRTPVVGVGASRLSKSGGAVAVEEETEEEATEESES